jgi:hypothetical protein
MRRRRRGEAGISLIETLVVLGSVTITILGILTAHVTAAQLNRTNHETSLASEAIRSRMEQICATTPDTVIATYDSNTANDPLGAGTAPGATFSLATLGANSAGDRGTVEMPLSGGQLREDVNNAALGMPKDLNGDGVIDSLDHTADWKILPILVRLRWKGVNGDREMRLATVLYR